MAPNKTGIANTDIQKRPVKAILKYLSVFILITGIQLGLLVTAAAIPNTFIKDNMISSADFLSEKQVFFSVVQSDSASRIDRYADSILLGIIYGYDNEHPLASVMRSSYYHTDTQNENDNLKDAVYNDLEPNSDYVRYWHGSAAVVKFLLIFFNLEQIYIINAAILLVLTIVMFILLKKHLRTGIAVCFLAAAAFISIWYVPFSLEYTWNFFIMFAASFWVIHRYKKNRSNNGAYLIFFLTGSFTAYFDFLTTETLTLLLPLVILLVSEYETGTLDCLKSGLRTVCLAAVVWAAGYASSWLAKWSLAALILDENTFQIAFSKAAIRISGEQDNISGFAQCIGALIRNLSCIFPFSRMGKNGYALCILCMILLAVFYYLFKKEDKSFFLTKLLLLPAIVPYIRFVILSNHSYLHCFFTYRAQMATLFCIALTLYYGIDRALLKKEGRKLWRKIIR